jgi:hypothetical protein
MTRNMASGLAQNNIQVLNCIIRKNIIGKIIISEEKSYLAIIQIMVAALSLSHTRN